MILTKKALSAVIAMAMSVGTAGLFPVTADAAAVNWEAFNEWGPEWFPKDFESAMDFYNTYGSTRVENDFVCIIAHVPNTCKMSTDIKTTYKNTTARPQAEYESKIFSFDFKLPEAPDESDAKAYADYLDKIERYKFHDITDSSSIGFHYEALLIMYSLSDGLDVKVRLRDKNTDEALSDGVTYSFDKNDEGYYVETDIYRWLPDSVPEFNDYLKKYGNVSFRDGMLIYCNNINYSTGADLKIEQSGEGKLKAAPYGQPVTDRIFQVVGETSSVMKLFSGETEGDVDITFTSGRTWDETASDHKGIAASVHVDDKLNVADNSIKSVPEWVPQDYASAVKFYNENGATFVRDGIICLVRRIESQLINELPVRFEGSVSDSIRSYELANEFFKDSEKGYYAYNVMAYDIPNDSDLTVNFRCGRFAETERTTSSYSFKKDSTGYITQTDRNFWLPDSDEEFERYYEKHGTFSVQDGYIMYCTNIPLSRSVFIRTQQFGSGALIEDLERKIDKHYVSESEKKAYDGQRHVIKLFKPIKPGIVKLVASKTTGYVNDDNYEDETAYYRITESMDIIPAVEKDLKTSVKGDCNGDGMIGISDAVALQRWLLKKDTLPDFGIADLNGDGAVDVFDLLAVKKLIVKSISEDPRPVMVLVSQNFAWTPHQSVTIVDQYGRTYGFEYENTKTSWEEVQKGIVSMYGNDWYDRLIEIMVNDKGTAGSISDKAMTEINKMSEKAEKYSKTRMYSVGYMCDAGSTSLYLVNKDADGNPVNAVLAEFGDSVGWIDDPEVKEFVKTLASYDIFGQNVINVLENDGDFHW